MAKTSEWLLHAEALSRCLERLSFRDREGAEVPAEAAFRLWTQKAADVREQRKTAYLIGNGASASMASHFAADLCKNGHMRTEVFTDQAQLTAMANDLGYDQVFAVPLRFRMSPGDLLVAISSSGQSPNVLAGVEAARQCGGYVVTLSAMRPDNALRQSGDLNCYLPADTYGMAETGHAAALHFWMDRVAETVEPVWD